MKLTVERLRELGFLELPSGAWIKQTNRGHHVVEPSLVAAQPKKRIRQRSRPLMNKLEQEWFRIVERQNPNYPRPRPQSVTFKLANGVRYTPDLFVCSWPALDSLFKPTAWEVKGKMAWDDAMVKLKVAAHEWPDIQWVLVWKENGEWKEQTIRP